MTDEQSYGLSAEKIDSILDEAGLNLPAGVKESFRSRMNDILVAIGIDGSDEFDSALAGDLDSLRPTPALLSLLPISTTVFHLTVEGKVRKKST